MTLRSSAPAALALAWILAGCGLRSDQEPNPVRTSGPSNSSGQAPTLPGRAVDGETSAVLERAAALLPPVASSAPPAPGIAVLDPICEDPRLTAFGKGCMRWLNLQVGASPALASSPMLCSEDRVREELKRTDLALPESDVGRFGQMVGATHVLTGRLTGSGERIELTCHWIAVQNNQPVGVPVAISGTRAEVAQRLPELADNLSQALLPGAKPWPSAALPSPEALEMAGNLWWKSRARGAPPAGLATAPSSPLIELVRLRLLSHRGNAERAKALIDQSRSNPLAFCEIGSESYDALKAVSPKLTALRQQGAETYATIQAQRWLCRATDQYAAEKVAAVRSADLAPQNPQAWLNVSQCASAAAERIRNGRWANDLSSQDWARLTPLYSQAEQAVIHAVRLDSQYHAGWAKLAEAATFGSHPKLADSAQQAAQRLAPEDLDVYSWGLQMYQPKWFDRPDRLRETERQVLERSWPTDTNFSPFFAELDRNQMTALIQQLATRNLQRFESASRADPKDGYAHYQVGLALHWLRRYAESIERFRQAVSYAPEIGDAHVKLGEDCFLTQTDLAEGVKELRTGLSIVPQDGDGHFYLGWLLKNLRRNAEAIPELEAAARLKPYSGNAHTGLAQLYEDAGNKDGAEREYQKAVDLAADEPSTYTRYMELLVSRRKYSQAIQVGTFWRDNRPNLADPLIELSYVYGAARRFPESANAARAALRLAPTHPVAHINLGEALCETGQRAAGRAELQVALSSTNPAYVKEARRLLAKFPADTRPTPPAISRE